MAQEVTNKLTEEIQEETATDGGVLASLGINGQLFVFQLINFAIVGAIVWFLILRPLTKKMEERRLMINESLNKAKEVETALTMSEIKYQERIDEAKSQANKIIERAHADAEVVGQDLKAKAKKEIQLLIDQAKRNIQIERDDAMYAVRKEAATLVGAAVEKIIGEKLDEKKDAKLIDETLKTFGEKTA